MEYDEILRRNTKSLRRYGAMSPGPPTVRHVYVIFRLQRILGDGKIRKFDSGLRTQDSGFRTRIENFTLMLSHRVAH